MNRHIKRYFLVICSIIVSIMGLIAVFRPFAQERTQAADRIEPIMNEPQLPSHVRFDSHLSTLEQQVIQLDAEEFHFETHLDFPASVLTDAGQYAEFVTPNQGRFDMTLMRQGNTVRYLLQISSRPEPSCEPNAARACQEAAPARGNVAEIQIVLRGDRLQSGTYPFGGNSSTPLEEVMIYSRQLYSDPSHGMVGCQAWGEGVLTIDRAVYNANGQLEAFDASLSRVCDRTVPFPPTEPGDNLSQTHIERIERYTFHAAWRSRLAIARDTQR